ncbi:hypothetical protein PIB30_081537 [Stylosanthes scabra]|uniref:Uncharacterized protein n=1 Tax=Stylosanthes scabra TaxID=79078 RepID=A0ABU6QSL3_9FABA|nr:hypothetical protein [Stylosanthes scabra]
MVDRGTSEGRNLLLQNAIAEHMPYYSSSPPSPIQIGYFSGVQTLRFFAWLDEYVAASSVCEAADIIQESDSMRKL